MSTQRIILFFIALWVGLSVSAPAPAMGSSFTYQGSLEDQGQPAHGLYDFRFRLINSDSSPIGTVNHFDELPVIQGVFTVELDFGPGINLYPGNFVRYLEIGIRVAGSSEPFEILSPLTQLHPVPYARRAEAVNPNAITNAALADLAVSNRVLGDNAVNSRVLATNAVQTVNIQNGAVNSDKLADLAVTNARLANGAVTNDKIASNTIRMNRMAGAYFLGVIGGVTLPPNFCFDFNLGISGAQVDDIPLLALRSTAVLPADVTLMPIRVVSTNTVQFRACNHSSGTRSWTSLPAIFATLR